jgi:hypothetical protein
MSAMYFKLIIVIAVAWAIVEMATAFKRWRLKPAFLSAHAGQLHRRYLPTGVYTGFLSCVFGLLGILIYGLLFAPLGAVCGGFALFRALGSRSYTALGLATLGLSLTLTAAVSSPSLWVAIHPYIIETATRAQELAAFIIATIQH